MSCISKKHYVIVVTCLAFGDCSISADTFSSCCSTAKEVTVDEFVNRSLTVNFH